MKYNKPVITLLGAAHNVVQGKKALGSPADNIPLFKTTVGAYEADE